MNGLLRYHNISNTTCITLLLILSLALPLKAAAQEALFREADIAAQSLPAKQNQLLEIIKARSVTAAVHIAHLANAPATLLQRGETLALNVAPGKSVVAVGEQVQRRGPSDISWAGPLQKGHGYANQGLKRKMCAEALERHVAFSQDTARRVPTSPKRRFCSTRDWHWLGYSGSHRQGHNGNAPKRDAPKRLYLLPFRTDRERSACYHSG